MTKSISSWQRLRRTPYQTFASIFMIFITLFVVGVFLILTGGLSAILNYFETKPQLTVFFKEEKDKAEIDQLSQKLRATGNIANISYVSKEEALSIYRDQNKNDPLLLEMVTAEILPSSLEISANKPRYLVELAEMLKNEPGIDEVVFQKDVIDTLISWTSTVRKIGVVFILFFLFSSIFILLTTIGMRIALHKEEIEILKLVGATPWYIKRPFIFEGIIYGVIGATSAFLCVSVLILYFQPFITSFLRGIDKLPLFSIQGVTFNLWPPQVILFVTLFLTLNLSGFLIGLSGSLFAVSRYMKY